MSFGRPSVLGSWEKPAALSFVPALGDVLHLAVIEDRYVIRVATQEDLDSPFDTEVGTVDIIEFGYAITSKGFSAPRRFLLPLEQPATVESSESEIARLGAELDRITAR